MVQTEKPSGKTEAKRQGKVETPKNKKVEQAPVTKQEKTPTSSKQSNDSSTKGKSKKDVKQKKEIPKKEKAEIRSRIPVSTKYAVAICKFIKGKKTGDAIQDLEQVMKLKKAVQMKGEIPHRKGRMMSGRFPVRASEQFITIIKGLAGNANVNGLDDPVIAEASASIASRPFGRFGRVRRKRTHVLLVARDVVKKIANKKKESRQEKTPTPSKQSNDSSPKEDKQEKKK